MPYVKLLTDVVYKGKKFKKGDIVEVGEDLGRKMVLAGQALFAAAPKEQKRDLEKMKKDELVTLCKELGLESCEKLKKDELIAAIKEAGGVQG